MIQGKWNCVYCDLKPLYQAPKIILSNNLQNIIYTFLDNNRDMNRQVNRDISISSCLENVEFQLINILFIAMKWYRRRIK